MWTLEWTLKIVIVAVITSYLVTGLLKTLYFYLISYYYWVKNGRLKIVKTVTYVEVVYNKNDDEEISNTPIEEKLEFVNWYECATHQLRQKVIDELEKTMSISMAQNAVELKKVKYLILIFQYFIDTLTWPMTTRSCDTFINSKKDN